MDTVAHFLLPPLTRCGWRPCLRDLSALRVASSRHLLDVGWTVSCLLARIHRPTFSPLLALLSLLVEEEGYRDDLDRIVCAEAERAEDDWLFKRPWTPPSWYDDSDWGD